MNNYPLTDFEIAMTYLFCTAFVFFACLLVVRIQEYRERKQDRKYRAHILANIPKNRLKAN